MQIFLRHAAYTDTLPNRFMTKAYDARLLFIVDGKGEMRFADRVEPFSANTLIYYPAGCAYLPIPDPQNPPRFVTVNFDFDHTHRHITKAIYPVAVDRFEDSAAISSHINCGRALYQKAFVLRHRGDLKGYFLEIADAFGKMAEAPKETAEALLQYVLCHLSDRKEAETGGLYGRILDYISANLITIRDNAQIAEALNYHPYYINQYFKSQSGKTLHKYILETRLHKAALLLRAGTDSVADVAEMVGFKNADHFSKCFKEQYHVTPTAFRKATMLI